MKDTHGHRKVTVNCVHAEQSLLRTMMAVLENEQTAAHLTSLIFLYYL